jgi:hypothetical protein
LFSYGKYLHIADFVSLLRFVLFLFPPGLIRMYSLDHFGGRMCLQPRRRTNADSIRRGCLPRVPHIMSTRC